MTFGPAVQMARMDLETTSATGAIDPRRSRAGFTLIEILLVIGLILLIGSLAIYNVANLTRMRDDRPVEEVLLTAVREARYQASTTKELCWLSYDGEKGTFHILSGGPATALPEPSTQSVFGSALVEDGEEEESSVSASALESFQVYVVEDEDPPEVKFFAIPPGTGLDGESETDPEDLQLRRVPFDPAGFTVPFQVKVDAGTDDFRGTVIFDPFSNHILNEEDLKK